MKPDYTEYLTPAQLAHEEQLWAECGLYQKYAKITERALKLSSGTTMREVGCGTGWVPTLLPATVSYEGFDKHPECVRLAQQKNTPTRSFYQQDIRTLVCVAPTDLVVTFAVLKHFGLEEWDSVFARILALGRWAAFTVPVTDTDYDDGVEFPHTHIGRQHLHAALAAAGHLIVESGPLEGEAEEWFITTLGVRFTP